MELKLNSDVHLYSDGLFAAVQDGERNALQQRSHALVVAVVSADSPDDAHRGKQRRQRLCNAADGPAAYRLRGDQTP